jgi:hypothetical protein
MLASSVLLQKALGLTVVVLTGFALAGCASPIGQKKGLMSTEVREGLNEVVGDWYEVALDPIAYVKVARGPGGSFLLSFGQMPDDLQWQAQAWEAPSGTWQMHVVDERGRAGNGSVQLLDGSRLTLIWSTSTAQHRAIVFIEDGNLIYQDVQRMADGSEVESRRIRAAPPLQHSRMSTGPPGDG